MPLEGQEERPFGRVAARTLNRLEHRLDDLQARLLAAPAPPTKETTVRADLRRTLKGMFKTNGLSQRGPEAGGPSRLLGAAAVVPHGGAAEIGLRRRRLGADDASRRGLSDSPVSRRLRWSGNVRPDGNRGHCLSAASGGPT